MYLGSYTLYAVAEQKLMSYGETKLNTLTEKNLKETKKVSRKRLLSVNVDGTSRMVPKSVLKAWKL